MFKDVCEILKYLERMKKIALSEIDSLSNPVLLDVRTPELFAIKSYPGAINICVHEIVFADETAKQISDQSAPIVLLGPSAESHEAEKAYGILSAKGFSNVSALQGGIFGWLQSENDSAAYSDASLESEIFPSYKIDLESSRLRWLGRNIANNHTGTLAFKEGRFAFEAGSPKIEECEVMVDMSSMVCEDLKDEKMAGMLIGHLKNDDFFKVDEFPTSTGKLIKVERVQSSDGSDENIEFEVELDIRGHKSVYTSRAAAVFTEGGKKLSLQGVLRFDRSAHGSRYGSKSFFQALGGHLVNNLIEIDYTINANAT